MHHRDQASNLRHLVNERAEQVQPQEHAPFAGFEPPRQRPLKASKMRTIAVSSGKGGVGKTSLVVNLALALAEFNFQVIILDGDLGLANVDVAFGVTPYYSFKHLLSGEKSIEEILYPVHNDVKVLPGGSGVAELANLDSSELKTMLINLKRLEGLADILLIDTGAGLNHTVMNFVCAADDMILVITPEPPSMTDAYGLLKTLKQETKVPTINVVVNRVQSETEALQAFERLNNASRRFLDLKVSFLGWVFDDPKIGRSIMAQKPVGISDPQSPSYKCVQWIASQVVGLYTNPPSKSRGIKGFIRSLLGLS